MTRKRKTEARKKRKLQELNAVKKESRKELNKEEGGSANDTESQKISELWAKDKPMG